jgi:hypothetical protein
MLVIILQILIASSLAGIVYMFARALPRLNEEEFRAEEKTHGKFVERLDKADDLLRGFFEKVLRRFKIWILKIDNVVSVKLNKFKKDSQKERYSMDSIREEKEESKEEKS